MAKAGAGGGIAIVGGATSGTPIRDRVNDVLAVASRIRQGALETMNGITAPELRQVVTDVDTQVRALQAAMRELDDLMFDDTARLPSRTPRA